MAVAVRFAFLPLFLLVVAFLALLELLSLLLLLAVHLLRLLLLAALKLVLPLLICVLAAQSLLLLFVSPLHFLAVGILLALHLVEVSFVLLLQSWIGGRVVGMARRGRAIGVVTVIFAASVRIASVWRTVSVVAPATIVNSAILAAATVVGSAVLDVAAVELTRTRGGCDFGAAMIDRSPEVAIAASAFKMTVLL